LQEHLECRFIPLETKDSVLLKDLYRVCWVDDRIFVFDRSDEINALFVFSDQGNFITRVGLRGQGPKEYLYLTHFFVDEKERILTLVDFGWPGIPVTLFGETFQWNILGYDSAHGGLPYFCAYMVAMVIGECINFPIQRSFVFRSKGNLAKQIAWYVVAFCIITCIVNSINCIWVAVAGLLVPDFIYNIGTTVLNGGISMVIFFFVNKIIFPEGEAKQA
jgi:putative flippase GtrA